MSAPMTPTQFVQVDLDSSPYALAARIQQELTKHLSGSPESIDKWAFHAAMEQVIHFASYAQEAMTHQISNPPANVE